MSKLFFDSLVQLNRLEKAIQSRSYSHEQKVELWTIVDDIIHHRVIHIVLQNLDESDHEEFLNQLLEKPHDDELLELAQKKTKQDISALISQNANELAVELTKILSEE